MADPSSTERLQPSLLDRLTDDAPTVLTEPREARVLTKGQLRTAVLRDLAALMNAICLGAGDDLSAYPEVERSVLNYGMPAFAGETASTLDVHDLEEGIRSAILRFEPRVLPNSLLVEAMAAIIGRLPRSRSPPQPTRQKSRPRQCRRAASRAFSKPSGVWAKSTTTSGKGPPPKHSMRPVTGCN